MSIRLCSIHSLIQPCKLCVAANVPIQPAVKGLTIKLPATPPLSPAAPTSEMPRGKAPERLVLAATEGARAISAPDPLPAVPAIFKTFPNWVTWEAAEPQEKKAPIISGTTRFAKTSDPSTWVSFETACANIAAGNGYSNLGFVTDGDRAGNLTGLDIDGCRDVQTGVITEWAQRILDLLGPTYVEVTPSKMGLRAWVTAVIPRGENVYHLALSAGHGDKVQVEVYDDRKYFTMTGDALTGSVNSVASLTNYTELVTLLRELCKQYPASKASAKTREKKSTRTKAIVKPDGSTVFEAVPPDPAFKELFERVGWAPLEKRMHRMHDARYRDLKVNEQLIYCPMPGHGTRDENVPYKPCFGVIKGNPAVVSCFGCNFSGDLVKAMQAFDAGEDRGRAEYRNAYECGRAICREEGIDPDEIFCAQSATESIKQNAQSTPAVVLDPGDSLYIGPTQYNENHIHKIIIPISSASGSGLVSLLNRELDKALGISVNEAGERVIVNGEELILEPNLIERPVFPADVMEGTSLYDGLVKPLCETSSKIDYFVFMPAVQMFLNITFGRVAIRNRTLIPNIFLGLISPYGEFFKSSSCESAHRYFNLMGYSEPFTQATKNANARTQVVVGGSSEGIGLQMQRVNAVKAIAYFEELSKFVAKAGIESSSLLSDICTWYEAGYFSNQVKARKDTYTFEAGKYCFGWLWCTVQSNFHAQWARLVAATSGLDDRMFFLLSPLKPKTASLFHEPNLTEGAANTARRISDATMTGNFDYEDFGEAQELTSGMNPRAIGLIEKYALYFAIDLGKTAIDRECVERARKLVGYREAVYAYLKPEEATSAMAALQNQMVRTLKENRSRMTLRNFERAQGYNKHSTRDWRSALDGLLERGRLKIDLTTRPRMIYLLAEGR